MFRNIITRICYLTIFVSLLLAYIFYRNYYFLIFLIFMVVLPAITIPMLYLAKKKIDITIEVPARVEKKAPVQIKLNLINSSYFPIIQSHMIVVIEHAFYPGSPEYHFISGIAAVKGSTVTFTLTPEYSGNVNIKIKSLRLWDFTGLWDFTISPEVSKDFIILPPKQDANILLSMVGGAGLVELSEQDVKGNDSSTVVDTREYIPGDSLKKIHWKLSTKLDKLLVKEYGSMSSQDVLVILEIAHGDFSKVKRTDENLENRKSFDSIFDAYYALSTCLLAEKRPFMVGWYSPAAGELKISEVTGTEELIDSLIMMFYEKPSKEPGNSKLLAKSVLDDYGDFLYIHPAQPQIMFDDGQRSNIIHEQLSEDGKVLSSISIVSQI